MRRLTTAALAGLVCCTILGRPIRGRDGTGQSDFDKPKIPYQQVEYIESTGTQWIDTKVFADLPLELSADVSLTQPDTGSTVQTLAGGHSGSIANSRFWIASFPQGKINCALTYNSISTRSVPVKQRILIDVLFSNGQQTVKVDGEVYTSAANTTSQTWFRAETINLLREFGSHTTSLAPLKAKVFAVKLWMQGALVRNFVPVRFLNDNGVQEGALYDKVTGELFKNSGTGTFMIGPDKN